MPVHAWRPLAALVLITALTVGASTVAAQQPNKPAPPKRVNPIFAPIEDKPGLPRVLLIGDSISIGYTLGVRKLLVGKANVHRAPTNCGPTIRGLEKIDDWLGSGKWDVIHFNWGLHDLKIIDGKHQVPLEDYEKNMQTLVTRLRKTGATLIWCSTTPVPQAEVKPPRSDKDVLAYNAAAQRIMQQHAIVSDDLYRFALPRLDKIQQPANVHFTRAGSSTLAAEVARNIEKVLAQKSAKKGKNMK